MNYEPLLDERSKNDQSEKNIKNIESVTIEKKKEENQNIGYKKYDVYHSANIISKIFFCWVNRVLSVINSFYIELF